MNYKEMNLETLMYMRDTAETALNTKLFKQDQEFLKVQNITEKEITRILMEGVAFPARKT